MNRTRIVVTANPDGWDGDMRTWEALASGALVLTDPPLTPLPFHQGLRDREHLVMYDNKDRESLLSRLEYYLTHPQEAAEIARNGREFVRRFHRPGSRMDYIDTVVRARAGSGESEGFRHRVDALGQESGSATAVGECATHNSASVETKFGTLSPLTAAITSA